MISAKPLDHAISNIKYRLGKYYVRMGLTPPSQSKSMYRFFQTPPPSGPLHNKWMAHKSIAIVRKAFINIPREKSFDIQGRTEIKDGTYLTREHIVWAFVNCSAVQFRSLHLLSRNGFTQLSPNSSVVLATFPSGFILSSFILWLKNPHKPSTLSTYLSGTCVNKLIYYVAGKLQLLLQKHMGNRP